MRAALQLFLLLLLFWRKEGRKSGRDISGMESLVYLGCLSIGLSAVSDDE